MAFNGKLLDGMMIFTAVVEAGGFSAASIKTGHSTSYISKEINKLEDRLGIRLLNRTTRSISLTPEGKIYFQQCLQIISEAENVTLSLTRSINEPKGLLRVSCPTSFGVMYLSPILNDFLIRYPEVDLEMDLNDRKVDVIADGFDVVIRATGNLQDSSLICRCIKKSKSVVVASPLYLETYGVPRYPTDLKHHTCICYSNLKIPAIWHFNDLNGDSVQVEVPHRVQCNSANLEVSLAMAGHGIIRVPEFYVEQQVKDGLLVPLFTEYGHHKIDVYVVYPSRKHLSSKVRAFIDFVSEKIQ